MGEYGGSILVYACSVFVLTVTVWGKSVCEGVCVVVGIKCCEGMIVC